MMHQTEIKQTDGLQTVHYFDSPNLTVDGNPARIIASERTGREYDDVKHSIRKHTGEVVEHGMAFLVKLWKDGRLR